MGKSADYVAKTFAKAAEIFALDDKLWFKTAKFTSEISKNKQLKMSDENIDKYTESMCSEIYNKYILTTLEENMKENGLLSRAKIRL